MTEIFNAQCLVIKSKREIKKKPNKLTNVSQNDFKILKMNEYEKLLTCNYNMDELKRICRYYKVKLSGNKSEISERLYNYLLKTFFIIKIQKKYRNHLILKYNKQHGPAFIKRNLCVNESDLLTLENLNDIPYNQFYSYVSNDNHVYGFDVVSLYTLVTRPGISPLNPYTRSEFPNHVLLELNNLINLSKILKIHIDIEIEKDVIMSIEKQINSRTLALFQKIDELGNYTNIEWFTSLTPALLVKFIRELHDIWAYRAQLSDVAKRDIC